MSLFGRFQSQHFSDQENSAPSFAKGVDRYFGPAVHGVQFRNVQEMLTTNLGIYLRRKLE